MNTNTQDGTAAAPLTIETIRAQFEEHRRHVDALPSDGSVLFCDETALAIAIPDGDADRGYITGLRFAHVFTDADRHQPPAGVPGLDRRYSDGAGRPFILTKMSLAKRTALERLDAAIKALPMVEG